MAWLFPRDSLRCCRFRTGQLQSAAKRAASLLAPYAKLVVGNMCEIVCVRSISMGPCYCVHGLKGGTQHVSACSDAICDVCISDDVICRSLPYFTIVYFTRT